MIVSGELLICSRQVNNPHAENENVELADEYPFYVADNPNTIESIVTPVIPAQETRLFQEQPDPISQMEDFDLFNSLDWSFDESLSVTLGPGFE